MALDLSAPAPTAAAPASFLDMLRAIVGAKHVVTGDAETAPWLSELRGLYHGRCMALVQPGSTEEVSRLMELCHATGTPVVPQGGNTGLVGGQIPDESGTQVLVSLRRLDRIRDVDPVANTMTAEAGTVLANVHAEAEKVDRLFPLSLAAEGSCTIGGNLATNAGGVNVIAYGNTRHLVRGIEVVLANGGILSNLSKLEKDNTGYDLKGLFIGSEGTLGIITAAVLKLFPRPVGIETAFIAVPDPAAALSLLGHARKRAGGTITSFELIPRIGVDFVLRHAPGTRDPLDAPSPWYVLIELSLQTAAGLRDTLELLLEAAIEASCVTDAVVATSLDQRNAFWKLREMLSEVQRHEGGSIKHDVSVPVSRIPRFLEEAERAITACVPGARMVAFGHVGDGNIHCNASQPVGADKAQFLAAWEDMNAAVHAVVTRMEGSISAEHGIGRLKRDLLPGVKNPVALDAMRAIKAALDPTGILNPGKVL